MLAPSFTRGEDERSEAGGSPSRVYSPVTCLTAVTPPS